MSRAGTTAHPTALPVPLVNKRLVWGSRRLRGTAHLRALLPLISRKREGGFPGPMWTLEPGAPHDRPHPEADSCHSIMTATCLRLRRAASTITGEPELSCREKAGRHRNAMVEIGLSDIFASKDRSR